MSPFPGSPIGWVDKTQENTCLQSCIKHKTKDRNELSDKRAHQQGPKSPCILIPCPLGKALKTTA